jgi:hypothetical protein
MEEESGRTVADPIADIIGDYRAFAAQQRDRLATRGFDIAPYELSHLAVRVPEWDEYVHLRTILERHAVANVENVWNGRPISMILLAESLDVLDGQVVPLIELIPPVHQRFYKMGSGAPRRGRRRGGRRLLPSAPGSADRPAVPERDERALLHPVRRFHPREVPPALAAVGDRSEGQDVRRHPAR